MSHPRPFQQVDVFTSRPYFGNPLAVVLDGSGLSDESMQRFARWTNLSETTFILPPSAEAAAAGADYQVRIFATHYEMPFAGHPTLGSCHAWLDHGGTPKSPDYIVQQCKVGLVRVRRAGPQRLAFAAPSLTRTALDPALLHELCAALKVPASSVLASQHLRNGPHHVGLLLAQPDTLLSLEPDHVAVAALLKLAGATGVGLAARYETPETPALIGRSNREARAFASGNAADAGNPADPADPDLEVRFFHLGASVSEDPITGSFNASLAQWLIEEQHMPASYVAAQGTRIGCEGRVHITRDELGQVWVGGASVTCVRGEVSL